jgi:hypothetical protein
VCIHERYVFKGGIPDDAHLKWMEENIQFPRAIRILHILHMRWEQQGEDKRREGIKELLKFFPNLKEIRLGRCLALRPDVLSVFDASRLTGVAQWGVGTSSMKRFRLSISRTGTSRFQLLQYTTRCLAKGRTGWAKFSMPGGPRRIWQRSAWSLPERSWYD